MDPILKQTEEEAYSESQVIAIDDDGRGETESTPREPVEVVQVVGPPRGGEDPPIS